MDARSRRYAARADGRGRRRGGAGARRTVQKDLDEAILGDLRTVQLPEEAYDVVYNSFVLEHIPDAERALENFIRWLKPGGLLILRTPDPQSVYGAIARTTPLWVHVLFKRFVGGDKQAGRPGPARSPRCTTRLSLAANSAAGATTGVGRRAEYACNYTIARPAILAVLVRALMKTIHLCSLGRLADDHINLTYVIEKPERAPCVAPRRATSVARSRPMIAVGPRPSIAWPKSATCSGCRSAPPRMTRRWS